MNVKLLFKNGNSNDCRKYTDISILNLEYRRNRLKHVTETKIMEEQNGYHTAGPCIGIKQITEDRNLQTYIAFTDHDSHS